MDEKMKHLEFIQNVITRMNSNSFLLKGWAVTLVSALFALAAKDANPLYAYISYIAIPMFWILDGFFLSQERQYRLLYEHVRIMQNQQIDFSMDARPFKNSWSSWPTSIWSATFRVFYLTLISITVLVMVIMFVLKCK